jgi:hypothetical protein
MTAPTKFLTEQPTKFPLAEIGLRLADCELDIRIDNPVM